MPVRKNPIIARPARRKPRPSMVRPVLRPSRFMDRLNRFVSARTLTLIVWATAPPLLVRLLDNLDQFLAFEHRQRPILRGAELGSHNELGHVGCPESS